MNVLVSERLESFLLEDIILCLMMVSLKNIETLTYRQLQTAAKRTKVPANLKKNYLIRLIIARSQGDENLIQNIVQDAYRERANTKGRRSEKIVTRKVYETSKFSDDISFTHKSNTELEKLLKAPMPAKIQNIEANFSSGLLENFSNSRKNSDIITHSEIQGMNLEDVRKNFHSNNCEVFLPNQNFNKTQTELTFIHNELGSTGNNSFLNIDKPYNSNDAGGLVNYYPQNILKYKQDNDFSKDISGFTSNTFSGNFGNEVLTASGSQQMTTSSQKALNSQQFHSKDNYIVINQHFQFFTTNISESQTIVQDHSYLQNYESKCLNHEVSGYRVSNQQNPNIFDSGNIYNGKYCVESSKNSDYLQYVKSERNGIFASNNIGQKKINNEAFSSHYSKFSMSNLNLINSIRTEPQKNFKLKSLLPCNINNISYVKESSRMQIAPYHIKSRIPRSNKSQNYKLLKKHCNSLLEQRNNSNSKKDKSEEIKKSSKDDFLREFMSLDLLCDIDEDISSSLQDYFANLDVVPNNNEVLPARTEKEVTPPKNYIQPCQKMNESQKVLEVSSIVCFICGRLGKLSDFDCHIRQKHSNKIFVTNEGMLTITLNMGTMRNNSSTSQQNFFIEHSKNLYVVHFEYKKPDIICPILLSIPQNGSTSIVDPSSSISKFYIQVNNLVKKEEFIWSGIVECINMPERPFNLNTYSNRKHGQFEISMRSLDLVPNNVALKDITKYVDSCIVEIHFFLETLLDLQNV